MTSPLIRPFALFAAILPLAILAFLPPSAAAQTINRPPRISGVPATSVQPGHLYSFRPSASDPEGRPLTFHITNRPGWANFDRSTGRLWGTPQARNVGRYPNIRITVGDGNSSTALPPFTITVGSTTTNTAPTISGSPPTTVRAGYAYYFRPTASDRDGNRLTFAIANKPGWATFSTATGALSGKPGSSLAGRSYSNITIRVTDGRATVSLPSFPIRVGAATPTANTAPSISGSPPTSVRVGQSYYFRPSASDREGNPLTFSIANRPSWATFNTDNGALSGTPGSGTTGTYSNVTIRVSDGRLTSSLQFTINVQPASTGGGGGTGSVALRWIPPTRRTDGSLLTNLAGFRIRYGTSPSNQPSVIQIQSTGVTSAQVTTLAPGTYYFSVCAFDAAGVASSYTAPVSITIR